MSNYTIVPKLYYITTLHVVFLSKLYYVITLHVLFLSNLYYVITLHVMSLSRLYYVMTLHVMSLSMLYCVMTLHILFLQDQLNEWANMTGFLCALGSVCLQNKSHRARLDMYTYIFFAFSH